MIGELLQPGLALLPSYRDTRVLMIHALPLFLGFRHDVWSSDAVWAHAEARFQQHLHCRIPVRPNHPTSSQYSSLPILKSDQILFLFAALSSFPHAHSSQETIFSWAVYHDIFQWATSSSYPPQRSPNSLSHPI